MNMDCEACALLIEGNLEDAGINAKCSYKNQTLEVKHEGKLDDSKVKIIVEKSGYNIV